MLRWSITFFVIALLAAMVAFTGLAVAIAGIAEIIFFVFLILALGALIYGFIQRSKR